MKGEILSLLGRYKESLEALDQVQQADPHIANLPFYRIRAHAYEQLQQYDEALAAYKQALTQAASPPDPQFYHDQGIDYESLVQQSYKEEQSACMLWEPSRVDVFISHTLADNFESIDAMYPTECATRYKQVRCFQIRPIIRFYQK